MTENNNGISVRDFAESEGVNVDTIQRRFRARFSRWVTESSVLTDAEISVLRKPKKTTEVGKRKPRISTENKKRVNSTLPPVPEAKASPVTAPKERKTFRESMDVFRAFALDAILVSVVAGHALLIWYDCAIQWGTPGTIGGGLAFAIVAAALLLATDETRARTSGAALYFVLCVDVAAWWVHFPTFQRPGVPDEITGVFAGFLCAASWVALYLYRDKNID